jgi:LysM repeat protein
VAPAAFLLAVTIAVLLVRSAIRSDSGPATTTAKPAATVVRKQYYKVRAGDTFGRIARSHRLTVTRLRRLNPRVSPTSLFIGQRIRVG